MNVIIIPCYNESKRLQSQLFVDFVNTYNEFTLLFVNDGSFDKTAELLQILSHQHSRLKFLNLISNVGKAEAVRQGVIYSLQVFHEAKFYGYFDADLATPLNELVRMDRYVTENQIDALLGTRFLHLGADIKRKTYRHYLGRVFATAVSLMLHLKVYDTQCGAKLFNSELSSKIFASPFISKWFFDVEILFRIIKFNKNTIIHEFPLKKWEDKDGSKLIFKDFLMTPFELLKIFYHYKKEKGD